MPLRTLLFVIVIAVIGAFAVLNWSAFAANTVISLGFTSLQAPLGLIMLGIVVVMTILFLFFIAYFQPSVLAALNQNYVQSQAVIIGKINEVEQQVLHTAKTTENSIVAYVAELDDRLNRGDSSVKP